MALVRSRSGVFTRLSLGSVTLKYRWDDFVVDLDGFRLERGGVPLALEPKAFNLLVLLMGRPGHVFTKQEIFEELWADTVVTDHALTRVVAQLRRVLGDEARDGRYIETVPTRGYRWRPKVEAIHEMADPGPPAAPVRPEESAAPLIPPRRALFPAMAVGLTAAVILMGIAAWPEPGTARENAGRTPGPRADIAWPVQLTTNPGLDLHPSFSPQGDAVAYASDRTGSFELYLRALAGTATEVPLTSDGRNNVQPAWSPDGSLVAFHSQGRGIWVMPARGGDARQLVGEGSHPAWSADGRRIAFQSDEPSDVTPSAFGAQSGGTIQVVDADGATSASSRWPGGRSADMRIRYGVETAGLSRSACSTASGITACGGWLWTRARSFPCCRACAATTSSRLLPGIRRSTQQEAIPSSSGCHLIPRPATSLASRSSLPCLASPACAG